MLTRHSRHGNEEMCAKPHPERLRLNRARALSLTGNYPHSSLVDGFS
jgi:hypothetical protein